MQLAILAAGLGTRFGGPKQFFPIGPNQECLFHYSAAFCHHTFPDTSLILITREEILTQAQESLKPIPIHHQIVLQKTPNGKPRGTADALLSALSIASPNEPLIILNADDFYGPESFLAAKTILPNLRTAAAIPYQVQNTLSPHGGVSRAICTIQNDHLVSITETHNIKLTKNHITSPSLATPIPPHTPVSMNFFLFQPSIQPSLQKFVNSGNQILQEITIPDFLQDQITNHSWSVPIALSSSVWFGMTFLEDRTAVQERLQERYKAGEQINQLW
jgi:molybdopterin-guanine dinucleotide biosynthesis protein A